MTGKPQTLQLELIDDGNLPNSTVFVLGATGCGKSTLMANLSRERPRLVVIDTRDEYPASFFGASTPVVTSVSAFGGALNAGCPKIICRVPSGVDCDDFVSMVCLQLCEFQRVNGKNMPAITFSMDELGKFVTQKTASKGLSEIIDRGRGHRIEKIFGAQWFNGLPTWVRNTFSEMYVFQHSEPRGLNMLEAYGFNSNEISSLDEHQCLYRRKGKPTLLILEGKKSSEFTKPKLVLPVPDRGNLKPNQQGMKV